MAPNKASVNVIYSKDEKPEPIAIILKHPTIRKNIIYSHLSINFLCSCPFIG